MTDRKNKKTEPQAGALLVDRGQLVEALRIIASVHKTPVGVRLAFNGNQLEIEAQGVWHAVDAEGNWPVPVEEVNSVAFSAIAEALPELAQIPISFDGGHVRISRWSFTCRVGASEDEVPPLPINPTPVVLIAYGRVFSTEQLERAGLLDRIERANDEYRNAVNKAFRALGQFYVARELIEEIIEKKIRLQMEKLQKEGQESAK